MKKLNTTELKVLAARIQNNLQEEAIQAQRKADAQSDLDNAREAQAIMKQLQRLGDPAKKYLHRLTSAFNTITVDTVLKSLRTPQKQVKRFGYNGTEIFNALVIGQIESKDLQELVRNVTAQFIQPKKE